MSKTIRRLIVVSIVTMLVIHECNRRPHIPNLWVECNDADMCVFDRG